MRCCACVCGYQQVSMKATSEAAALYYVTVFLVGNFVFLNLLLAVLINGVGLTEKELDAEEQARLREDQRQATQYRQRVTEYRQLLLNMDICYLFRRIPCLPACPFNSKVESKGEAFFLAAKDRSREKQVNPIYQGSPNETR